MPLHDLDRLNEGLARAIDALMPRLFANAKRVGDYWELGDITGAPGASLKVWRRGAKQGEWADFSAGTGGRPLSLAIASPYAGNGHAGEGIRWAARFLGHDASESPEERERREADAARQRQARAADEALNREKRRRAAQALFLAGVPVLGTPADAYLAGRGIDLRKLPRLPGALRFHPDLRCPETGRRRPGMLAAVAGEAGFLSVHRTFLYALPCGEVVKANDARVPSGQGMADAKQSYSAVAGGCISIWRGEDATRPLKKMVEGEWIVATEGIEDALSIAIAAPEMRIVACVALPFLGGMFLPKACAGVTWHRHRGDGADALAQLARQYAALEKRGIAVREVWAPDAAKDFNAWLMGQRERESA